MQSAGQSESECCHGHTPQVVIGKAWGTIRQTASAIPLMGASDTPDQLDTRPKGGDLLLPVGKPAQQGLC